MELFQLLLIATAIIGIFADHHPGHFDYSIPDSNHGKFHIESEYAIPREAEAVLPSFIEVGTHIGHSGPRIPSTSYGVPVGPIMSIRAPSFINTYEAPYKPAPVYHAPTTTTTTTTRRPTTRPTLPTTVYGPPKPYAPVTTTTTTTRRPITTTTKRPTQPTTVYGPPKPYAPVTTTTTTTRRPTTTTTTTRRPITTTTVVYGPPPPKPAEPFKDYGPPAPSYPYPAPGVPDLRHDGYQVAHSVPHFVRVFPNPHFQVSTRGHLGHPFRFLN